MIFQLAHTHNTPPIPDGRMLWAAGGRDGKQQACKHKRVSLRKCGCCNQLDVVGGRRCLSGGVGNQEKGSKEDVVCVRGGWVVGAGDSSA